MTNLTMPANRRPAQNAPYGRRPSATPTIQTSLEGLRPLVNQLNQYFEKTRHSPAVSQRQ